MDTCPWFGFGLGLYIRYVQSYPESAGVMQDFIPTKQKPHLSLLKIKIQVESGMDSACALSG